MKNQDLQSITEQLVAEFLNHKGIKPGSKLVSSTTLFQAFTEYAVRNGHNLPLNGPGFGRAASKSLPKTKRSGGTFYLINQELNHAL